MIVGGSIGHNDRPNDRLLPAEQDHYSPVRLRVVVIEWVI